MSEALLEVLALQIQSVGSNVVLRCSLRRSAENGGLKGCIKSLFPL